MYTRTSRHVFRYSILCGMNASVRVAFHGEQHESKMVTPKIYGEVISNRDGHSRVGGTNHPPLEVCRQNASITKLKTVSM